MADWRRVRRLVTAERVLTALFRRLWLVLVLLAALTVPLAQATHGWWFMLAWVPVAVAWLTHHVVMIVIYEAASNMYNSGTRTAALSLQLLLRGHSTVGESVAARSPSLRSASRADPSHPPLTKTASLEGWLLAFETKRLAPGLYHLVSRDCREASLRGDDRDVWSEMLLMDAAEIATAAALAADWEGTIDDLLDTARFSCA